MTESFMIGAIICTVSPEYALMFMAQLATRRKNRSCYAMNLHVVKEKCPLLRKWLKCVSAELRLRYEPEKTHTIYNPLDTEVY